MRTVGLAVILTVEGGKKCDQKKNKNRRTRLSGCESGPEVVVSPEAETLLDKMLQLCTWKHQDYTNSKDTKKDLPP